MGVQVTLELAQLDELRQLALPRGLELAGVLAQLGRDVLVAEVRVELLLAPRSEELAALDLEHAVFGDREPAADGLLAHRHVVLLRAREVLQEVAVALRRHDAQVETQTLPRDDRRLRPALRDHLGHPR